ERHAHVTRLIKRGEGHIPACKKVLKMNDPTAECVFQQELSSPKEQTAAKCAIDIRPSAKQ
ncbi:MAG: hypothetical protein ACPHX4_06300, partial [Candidatus Puniceispirillaceae bacterium]